MTDDEFASWMSHTQQDYVAQRVRSGESDAAARARARTQYAEFFPGGRPAPGHRVWVAEHSGEAVGWVWVGPHDAQADPSHAWLFSIEIDPARRGQGLGRATLAALEDELARDGVTELGLNVFAGNETARRLYATAGYRERAVSMSKTLS